MSGGVIGRLPRYCHEDVFFHGYKIAKGVSAKFLLLTILHYSPTLSDSLMNFCYFYFNFFSSK